MGSSSEPTRGNLFFRRVVLPLGRAAIKLGVRYPELEALLKESYVAAVAAQHGIQSVKDDPSGEQSTLMDGISPQEANNLLAHRPSIGETAYRMPPIADLVYAWFRRPGYDDESGKPRALPIAGKAPSFQALVEEFCTDQSPESVLSDLISAKTVSMRDDGCIELTGFYHYSLKNLDARIDHAAMAAASFIDTAVRKAVEGEESESTYRFGLSRCVATEDLGAVMEQLNDVIIDAQQQILTILVEAESRSRGRSTTTLGAGVFSFIDDRQEVMKPG